MSFFAKLKEAKLPKNGNPIGPGSHLFKIKACKLRESQKKKGAVYFVAELEVVESSAEDHTPGSERSWAINLNGEYPDTAMGDVKGFMLAGATSMFLDNDMDPPTEDDIDEEFGEAVIEGSLADVLIHCEAWVHTTQKDREFTKTAWSAPQQIEKKAAS